MTQLTRAEAYDRHTGRYAPELAVDFVRFAGVAEPMRALDVGCGSGALAAALAAVVGPERVAAVDPSAEYVEACSNRLPGVDARLGAAENLPFESSAFDAVLAQFVIQALDDPPLAAREIARVAAPGAVIAACVWDFQAGMPLLEAYWGAARSVDPEGARRAGGDEANPWCTPEGLRRLWLQAGAAEVEIGVLSASGRYEDLEDAWWSFEAGIPPSGAYLPGTRRRAAGRAAAGVPAAPESFGRPVHPDRLRMGGARPGARELSPPLTGQIPGKAYSLSLSPPRLGGGGGPVS